MEDILVLEDVERYLNGEMSQEEIAIFDDRRKKNTDLDQLVVEHAYFLQGLDTYSTFKSFKHSLQEVESTLSGEGLFAAPALTGKAKVINLWNKYKRSMAVAASMAGFISLLTLGLMITYTKKYGNENYVALVKEITKTNREVIFLKSKNSLPAITQKPEPKVDFRGTGFLIDGKGYLVTNAHVINKMKNIYIENTKGQYYNAVSVLTDNTVDLAILKINDTSFKAVTNLPYSIKKNNSDLGEQFFTLGFPRNEIVYGEGYVSAKSGNDGDTTSYQLTVSANPGNSGGPVINRNGEIIGIITAKDSKADGVVYAVKSKNIFKLLDKVKEKNEKYSLIKTPANANLKGLERVQQVKKMEDFVYMVVGN
ncbi:S1C family serine protease [Ferruginibacter sp.]|uniref:S1C family serine protease n=1 Tax=Ferruginibacter sp. TaxID=1940288 RepID=UPI0019A44771|nr:trypsin-like peptidase domain-containing protein [Ferruginibacter sp.]MBC7626849.1 trypsin-like peptidase domain-containing protein [Ferruginibacter sp.]